MRRTFRSPPEPTVMAGSTKPMLSGVPGRCGMGAGPRSRISLAGCSASPAAAMKDAAALRAA